jgi:SAM-dependent methyltransferase
MSFDCSELTWGADKARLSPNYLQALKLRWCLRDLSKVKGKVLDLGCGMGALAKAIKHYRSDLEVIGIDMVKEAIRGAKKDDRGVEFIVMDAKKLRFKDNSFSAVVSFDVLEHIEGMELVLREAYRVLKPGGVFHNFVPLEGQSGTLYWFLKMLGWRGKKMAGHINVFDEKSLGRLLREAGFRIKSKKFGNHWFYQLMDIVHHTSWQILGKRPVRQKPLGLMKTIVAPILYLESRLLVGVSGGAVSLGAVK